MSLIRRTDRSVIGNWWWTLDRPTFFLCLLLMILGVFLVSAASPPVATRIGLDPYHFIIKHVIFLIPSAIGMVVLSLLEPKWLLRFSAGLLIGGFLAMLLTLYVGDEIKGAQRWIHIFGFSIQPSELVKPAFIFVSAWMIAAQRQDKTIPGYYMAGGIYVVFLLLLLMQPDFGMAFVMTCVFGGMVFLAGLPLRWLAVFCTFVVGGSVLAYTYFDHVKSRFDRFMDPDTGNTYQIDKSLEAFQAGGFFGTGPGQGNIKLYLPDSHSDFIFSVAGEELGLVFVIILLGIYALIIFRSFNRLIDTENLSTLLAVGGLLILFGLQTFIHMGSSLSILPTKGMTLPFISYGGSSLLSTCIVMGMVLSLTRRQGSYTSYKKQSTAWSG